MSGYPNRRDIKRFLDALVSEGFSKTEAEAVGNDESGELARRIVETIRLSISSHRHKDKLENEIPFTDRLRQVMNIAREEAYRLRHDYIGTEHLLLGLLREGESLCICVLQNLLPDLEGLDKKMRESIRRGEKPLSPLGYFPLTSRARKVFLYSREASQEMGNAYLGTEHLLIGLIRENEGIASQVLCGSGITLEAVKGEIARVLGKT